MVGVELLVEVGVAMKPKNKKARRVVVASGRLEASLLSAWIDCGLGVPKHPVLVPENELQSALSGRRIRDRPL